MRNKRRRADSLERIPATQWEGTCGLSTSEFESVFDRECALAKRSQRSFTLLVFHPSGESNGKSLSTLGRVFEERLRKSDVFGRLDSERLAALLPETDVAGAGALADEIVSQLADAGGSFDFEIYAYPGQKPRPSVVDERPPDDKDGRPPSNGHVLPLTGYQKAGYPKNGSEPRDALESGERSTCEAVDPADLTLAAIRRTLGPRPAYDLRAACRAEFSVLRRAVDIAVAGSLLVLLSPLLLLVALAIKLTSRGPVIFVQQRAGLNGTPFPFYKFRSMYQGAEAHKRELSASNEQDGPIFKIKNDPRKTPIGRFMRKTSIDELPQLWSVLCGDMTLVGPRPPTLDEVEEYEPWQLERLTVKGGLTCIWQVSGRSEVGFEEWVRMDLQYADRQSALLDLSLLLRTAKAVASGRGAY